MNIPAPGQLPAARGLFGPQKGRRPPGVARRPDGSAEVLEQLRSNYLTFRRPAELLEQLGASRGRPPASGRRPAAGRRAAAGRRVFRRAGSSLPFKGKPGNRRQKIQ